VTERILYPRQLPIMAPTRNASTVATILPIATITPLPPWAFMNTVSGEQLTRLEVQQRPGHSRFQPARKNLL
jgi:hypothetical protein